MLDISTVLIVEPIIKIIIKSYVYFEDNALDTINGDICPKVFLVLLNVNNIF